MNGLDLCSIEDLVNELIKRTETCLIFADGLASSRNKPGCSVGLYVVNGTHSNVCELLMKCTVPTLLNQPPENMIEEYKGPGE